MPPLRQTMAELASLLIHSISPLSLIFSHTISYTSISLFHPPHSLNLFDPVLSRLSPCRADLFVLHLTSSTLELFVPLISPRCVPLFLSQSFCPLSLCADEQPELVSLFDFVNHTYKCMYMHIHIYMQLILETRHQRWHLKQKKSGRCNVSGCSEPLGDLHIKLKNTTQHQALLVSEPQSAY